MGWCAATFRRVTTTCGLSRPLNDRSTTAAPSLDDLCRTHMALVHHEVRSISARLPGHVNLDDLVSAGMSALVNAARSFDDAYGVPFGRFAVRRIRGALLDELRSADWASRSTRVRMRARNSAQESLAARLGRTPTPGETATEMGIDVRELDRLETELHHSVVLRIDHLGVEAGSESLLPATAETPESVLVERERQAYLRDAVDTLPERLRTVIAGCFFEDRPMRELAQELGVSESRISQMRSEALRLLRDGMNSQLSPTLLSDRSGGVAAGRREAYYAQIAGRSSYHARLTMPVVAQHEMPLNCTA